METNKIWFRELPEKLEGYVVVVDAWAAPANMTVLLSKKPNHLIVVNEINVDDVRKVYPNGILIGESDILPPSSFKWSNTLADMIDGDVTSKNVLWMSVNGSRVFEETISHTDIKEVLAGSLQNYTALVNHLRKGSERITIVMAGNRKREDIEEDRVCGQMLEDLLNGKKVDMNRVTNGVVAGIRAYGMPEMAQHNIPYLLKTVDKYNIVPRCFKNTDGFLEIRNAI